MVLFYGGYLLTIAFPFWARLCIDKGIKHNIGVRKIREFKSLSIIPQVNHKICNYLGLTT